MRHIGKSIEGTIKAGVGIIVLALIVNASLSYRATRTLIQNDELVSRSHAVLAELELVLSTLKDAETGVRGFFITGADEYLEPYEAAIAQIDGQINKLEQMSADNPFQRERIPILRQKVAARLDVLKSGIEMRRNAQEVPEFSGPGAGKRMMDDLREFINGMKTVENGLLAQRTEQSGKSERAAVLTFVIANLIAVALLIGNAISAIKGIRAQNRAESALNEQHQLLEVTLSSIADGVIVCDVRGLVTFLNPVAQSLTGWKQDEAARQPLPTVFKIVNEETRQIVENPALRSVRAGETAGLPNHTVLIRKDGSELPIDDSAAPIETADGKAMGAVLIFRDIAEQRRAERERAQLLAAEHAAWEQAEVANRSKDEFLAMLSHELRTPLTSVFGWVQMLKKQTLDPPAIERALAVIDRNLLVQTKLIDDLLNVSQIILGKLQIHRETVDALQITKATIETVRPSADAKQITLRLENESNPPAISADPARLQQIVWNLLSNAVKFTPKNGTIVVSVRQVNSELRIMVSDTGEGISAEFLPQAFNRFTQADASRTRVHSGLGLGLALVRQLVELHGGIVHAESDGPGKGSTFTVTFPLPGVLTRSRDQTDEKQPRPSLHGVRVLLAEDQLDTREMIALVLEQFGASVVQASCAAEALSEFVAAVPDILISDIGMPDADGYELLAMIQSHTPNPPPAIALTAYTTPADKERAYRSGFRVHMSKPVELLDLVSTVAELSHRRANASLPVPKSFAADSADYVD